jgi:phage FluMu protein Com
MDVIICKECGESIYLTPHAFWNITDFGAKCPRCKVINTIKIQDYNGGRIIRIPKITFEEITICIREGDKSNH